MDVHTVYLGECVQHPPINGKGAEAWSKKIAWWSTSDDTFEPWTYLNPIIWASFKR